ncbi:hypothetical protein ACGFIK_06345 [Micromonospora sp. NPDC048871]|uniref:hypothetical protein n=1 Tax=unclassified Micromonospora TaxID=2617518 RepID=UPI002E13AB06|nr:hypothetical protein OIE53_04025 [Micromonospora sp. NBC_01739]
MLVEDLYQLMNGSGVGEYDRELFSREQWQQFDGRWFADRITGVGEHLSLPAAPPTGQAPPAHSDYA